MSFIDIIKKSVINEFTNTISVSDMLISLAIAFLIGLYIVYIYRKTYTGVVYSKSFSLCIILLALVTAMILRTISSNLALSLGMVGALSIVRFRTAIKEPIDTTFMFWAIAAGIMTGAGLYVISILSSLVIGVFYVISYSMSFKLNTNYLLIIRYDINVENQINEVLKTINKKKLKSKSLTKEIVELTYEVEIKEDIIDKFKNIDNVYSTSLISYQNDFGA